jgi:uncharacterized protein
MKGTNNDLVFNVAQLMKEPIGSTRKLELNTPELVLTNEDTGAEAAALQARDLQGNAKVTRLSRDLLVQGQVAAEVLVECSRCLDQFWAPVEGKLEEEFQPSIDVETGRPVPRESDEENDTAFEISANHEMDLTEPVRQSIIVSLPLKPLCREDCKGLCPQCGANWNEGLCDCETEVIDNRWQALRELQLEDLPAGDNNLN